MFVTDSFMNAEVTYRADRIRRSWAQQPARVVSRRRRARDADAR